MTFLLTTHAIDRYRERHADSPVGEVRRYLAWALPLSESLGRDAEGQEYRRLACGAVAVAKPCGDSAVVVTVLPPMRRLPAARRPVSGRGFDWWRLACG